MENEILEMIVVTADISAEDIKDEADLLEDDLGMDSLMMLDLVTQIEQLTAQKMKPEEIVALKSVRDVIDFVGERVN